MCDVCGCGHGETRIEGHHHSQSDHTGAGQHDHPTRHGSFGHAHSHGGGDSRYDFGAGPARAHAPGLSQTRMVQIEQDILAKNSAFAAENRRYFAAHGILALNLVSSPGSGKTTLLARTIAELAGVFPIAVIEGDQQTSRDADRIRAAGVPALQINTGKGCHLDAHMVGHALCSPAMRPALENQAVLFIENVGNLVCPASFDLGEDRKVAVLSVTEGDDKPLKYPDMFHAADLVVLNKVDLLPHVEFDTERCVEYARRIKPDVEILQVSAATGDGMSGWYDWLQGRRGERLAALASATLGGTRSPAVGSAAGSSALSG